MTRPLKDREGNEPAQNISLTITRPRLEWLRNMAAAQNTSMSGAVELLIDRARGGVVDGDAEVHAALKSLPPVRDGKRNHGEPEARSLHPSSPRPTSSDAAKAKVVPIPKRGQ